MAKTADKPTKTKAVNPLLGPWRTPFKAPPFDRIEAKHFAPAFNAALKEHKAEIRDIAERTAKPSFQNTIVALEKSGALLNRVAEVFFASHPSFPERIAAIRRCDDMRRSR